MKNSPTCWQVLVKTWRYEFTIFPTTCTRVSKVDTHHEVLLQWWPGVHDWDWGHSVERLEGDDLPGELREATVHCTLWRTTHGNVRTLPLRLPSQVSRERTVHPPTSRVPLKELTDVMMWTGWIRRVFHSWFKMSVRSMIFWRLVLNMLWKSANTFEEKSLSLSTNTNHSRISTEALSKVNNRKWVDSFVRLKFPIPWPHQPVWSVWAAEASCTQTWPSSSSRRDLSPSASLWAPWSTCSCTEMHHMFSLLTTTARLLFISSFL